MAAPRYHVFVGAETGLLKGHHTVLKQCGNLICSSLFQIYAGIRSQTVKTFCPNSGICKDVFEVKGGEGPIKGLGVVNSSRHLVTCVSSGLLRVWAKDGSTEFRAVYQSFHLSASHLAYRQETEVGADVFRMRQHPRKEGIVATGGKENEPQVVGPGKLAEARLHGEKIVPVWVTDMDFLKDSEKIIAITGHHQVRVYDPNCRQRRPVVDFEFDEYPLTCLSLTPRPEQVVVGNSHGRVGLLDIRRKGMVHVYKGVAGSIRAVCCHPTLPIVASCGLDRFVRVHDLHSRLLITKLYLKSRLNCLLMRTDFTIEDEEENKDREEATIDDELWEEMEEVDEATDVSAKKASTKRSCRATMTKSKKRRKSIKQDG
ncbi:hypothetical protein HPB51_014198 [Rhipicephalus microplus]|uniref:Ribosome biogenesis protein NSA1 n=1 Tax=Rhipicephalus microplus TaxID=6941 RepID=A0A9J6E174_RHIMP|nr:hypothetical protein HPB51_014198 [Rhipicephalus microplus]